MTITFVCKRTSSSCSRYFLSCPRIRDGTITRFLSSSWQIRGFNSHILYIQSKSWYIPFTPNLKFQFNNNILKFSGVRNGQDILMVTANHRLPSENVWNRQTKVCQTPQTIYSESAGTAELIKLCQSLWKPRSQRL